MKYKSILVVSFMLLSGFLGTRFAQGEPLTVDFWGQDLLKVSL
jgi:hypothetical protein